ncbi:MAG: (Fe-S)-binding protein [Candidatus Hodarchaeota archaeon]
MKSRTKIVSQLKQLSKEIHVLTDLEDRYVYSFEKIFTKQAYPALDIVVKVSSPKETSKIIQWAEKEDISLIWREKPFSSLLYESKKPVILIDDAKIPELEIISEKNRKKKDIDEIFQELQRNVHSIYRNTVLATKTSILNQNIIYCLQKSICSGYCTVTPSFNEIETWSSKGRMLLIKGLMKGALNLSDKIIDIIYTCSKCGHCFAECYPNSDFHKAITTIRNKINSENLSPKVFHEVAANIFEHGDPSATPVERRLSWLKNVSRFKLPKKADNLYWVGCMVATRTPNTAKSLFNILNHNQIDFTMLDKNEGCCGYVLVSSGLWDEAKKVANEVIKRIEKINVNNLITPCAGCYYTFKKLYPEILGISLPCEVLHSSQFLEEILNENEMKLNAIPKNISYHDPCSLGRHCGVYEAPRNVLKAIPKLNFNETQFNKKNSRCCGGGGGLWTYNYRVSMDSAYTRLKEDFLSLNADILITACPQCQMNFNITSRRKSIPLQIKDIVEIVELAMIL